MAQTKQVKAAAPLNNGLPGGSFNSGDGVTLFNTTHTTIAGSFSNTLATGKRLKRNFIRASND